MKKQFFLLGWLLLGIFQLAVFTLAQEHDDFFGHDADQVQQDENFRPSSTVSSFTSTSTTPTSTVSNNNPDHTDFFGQDVDEIQSDEDFHPSSTISKASAASASAGGAPSGSQNSVSSLNHGPLQYFEKLIVAHGVLSTVAFLVVLPIGIYLARFTRTFNSKWYAGHWITQGIAGGILVVVGLGLGFLAEHKLSVDFSSRHKTIGKTIIFLYIFQCALGAFIHFVKIPFRFGRPPQNYGHAVLGLVTIGLSVYQVRLGYAREWPNATGRDPLSNKYTIVWLIWTILLAMLYVGGLTLLPRQWSQERAARGTPHVALHEYKKVDLMETDHRE